MGILDRLRGASPGEAGLSAGALHRGTGAAKEVAARSLVAFEWTREKLRENWPQEMQQAAGAYSKLADISKGSALGASEIRQKTESLVGETAAGQALGRAAQRGQARASQLPLISLLQDVMNANHDVAELMAIVRSDPNNPYALLWLGEALRRRERDMAVYRAARTAVDPTTILTREALKTMGRLNRPGSGLAPSEVWLRRAYSLANKRVACDSRDADAYHVIARYYLATGKAAGGLKAAKMAVVAGEGQTQGAALYTLASIYLAMDLPAKAGAAARAAIKVGCSLGNRVLADLLYLDVAAGGSSRDRMREFSVVKSRVQTKDLVSYQGSHSGIGDKVQTVVSRQLAKAGKHLDQVTVPSLGNTVPKSRPFGARRGTTELPGNKPERNPINYTKGPRYE